MNALTFNKLNFTEALNIQDSRYLNRLECRTLILHGDITLYLYESSKNQQADSPKFRG